jgi:N-acetylmuramoyl-L-alanine amidase
MLTDGPSGRADTAAMAEALWLADVLRAAGLTVVEQPGWRTHRRPRQWRPTYGVVHATAAPRSQSDEEQVRVVRKGRSDLPGPIANACVDRRGRWHVISAGNCNTTLNGTAGPFNGLGNRHALGVEACNNNGLEGEPFEPWPEAQYRSYVRGWAAICRKLGWTEANLVGHKEHTPGHKSDPTFSMKRFRADVADVLAGKDNDVGTLEGRQADQLRDTHFVLAKAVPDPRGGDGRVPLHTWCAWMTGAVMTLTNAVGNLDEATRAQIKKDLDKLSKDIAAVPDATVDAFADGDSPEEIADRLKALLGDRAAIVGALLAQD